MQVLTTRIAAVVLLSSVGPAFAAAAPQRTLSPGQAIAQARPGETVLIAPGIYRDCAVEHANHMTIAGAGPGVVFSGKTCAGKAILVIDGDDVTVRNLTLEHARVAAHNGAGIRAEAAISRSITFASSTMKTASYRRQLPKR